MRCRDLLCQHAEKSHEQGPAYLGFWIGACRRCSCQRFREVIPRHQQLQCEFAKMSARGEVFIDWLSVPDPTAERKPGRGTETVGDL
jgi:hypothetical protein